MARAYLALIITSLVTLSSGSSYQSLPSFPSLTPGPKILQGFEQADGPNRDKVCAVNATAEDAGPAILSAARMCNNGGTVLFPPDQEFLISSSVDLTFLDHIDFAILGTIRFHDDVDSWPGQTFDYTFQNLNFRWRFGGSHVNIYGNGTGVIDGQGQAFWTAMVDDPEVQRPSLFGTDGLHHSTLSGLIMKNSPNWFAVFTNSSNILVSDLTVSVEETDPDAPPHNTDAFDTLRSSNVIIQDSVIVNNDDCVSFKPNSTSMVVQNLDCTGSHGISVGSLGQYVGEIDIVEDITVYNVTMSYASDVARIKVWPGLAPGDNSTDSGGGGGRVKNITYEYMQSIENDHAIAITQCYATDNQTLCDLYPSELTIEDVSFSHFSGTTNDRYAPRMGELICSSPDVCFGISASDIDIKNPSNETGYFTCHNFDLENVELNCREVGSD